MKRTKELTLEILEGIKPSYIKAGYNIPKWITFSEELLKDGWSVKLYRAKTTVSKYLHVIKEDREYKIRFSNHKPNKRMEETNDADFYVGVSNKGIITTESLLQKLKEGTENESS